MEYFAVKSLDGYLLPLTRLNATAYKQKDERTAGYFAI
jgi:hypothetical protein